jgi:hypothetical protein
VFLEKLIVAQVVMTFCSFNGTQRFITKTRQVAKDLSYLCGEATSILLQNIYKLHHMTVHKFNYLHGAEFFLKSS